MIVPASSIHREFTPSQFPGVVGPVQHGLALLPPALQVAGLAVLPDRRNVPRDRSPSPNLPDVVGATPAHVVAAVPLEPAAWVLFVDPALAAPDRTATARR